MSASGSNGLGDASDGFMLAWLTPERRNQSGSGRLKLPNISSGAV
jgi:hypothetical protein